MTLYYYLDVFYTHFLCFVLFCTCEIWPNDLIYITTFILTTQAILRHQRISSPTVSRCFTRNFGLKNQSDC